MAITKILNIMESGRQKSGITPEECFGIYSGIQIRQKNVYWWAVLTACWIQHLSRWKRRKYIS